MATRRTDPAPTQPVQTAAKTAVRRASRSKPKTLVDPPTPAMSEQSRRAMIAEAAYYHAERRGFAPGGEEHGAISWRIYGHSTYRSRPHPTRSDRREDSRSPRVAQ